jgi:hypothetical protein
MYSALHFFELEHPVFQVEISPLKEGHHFLTSELLRAKPGFQGWVLLHYSVQVKFFGSNLKSEILVFAVYDLL